ncbi:MAG TPA: carotenoid biosynthesis protein [Methylomirabilota bacterium]|nr:carotenoid biosynthesis protein [Methylomirabilota bacterium]
MSIDLLTGTLVLRPYVFGFLAAFLAAGRSDLGWRRTLLFGACVSPVAWLAEASSTRTGVPFGLYHYTGDTHGRELFLANVPFMDPLSFSFLAYASFCLARTVLRGRQVPPLAMALATGGLMMLLDVVIDPVAVRGDRWFLGRVFYYAEAGAYFGVPLSNFAGWVLVGAVGTGAYVCCGGWLEAGLGRRWPDPGPRGSDTSGLPVRRGRGSDTPGLTVHPAGPVAARALDPYGRRAWPGIALYYAVLAFNLGVTAWIGEWLLLAVGAALHVTAAAGLLMILQRPAVRLGLEKQRA